MIKKEPELPFKTESFARAWDEWISYRKERRLPKYVPTGLSRTFSGLIRDSLNDEATAIEMIHQAIEKNWQGLFPIKKITNGTHLKPVNAKQSGAYALRDKARNHWLAAGGKEDRRTEI
jgi:hypothetical protein